MIELAKPELPSLLQELPVYFVLKFLLCPGIAGQHARGQCFDCIFASSTNEAAAGRVKLAVRPFPVLADTTAGSVIHHFFLLGLTVMNSSSVWLFHCFRQRVEQKYHHVPSKSSLMALFLWIALAQWAQVVVVVRFIIKTSLLKNTFLRPSRKPGAKQKCKGLPCDRSIRDGAFCWRGFWHLKEGRRLPLFNLECRTFWNQPC